MTFNVSFFSGPPATQLDQLFFFIATRGIVTAANATTVTQTDAQTGAALTLGGSGFTFGNGQLTGGTVTSITLTQSGATLATFTGFSRTSVATLQLLTDFGNQVPNAFANYVGTDDGVMTGSAFMEDFNFGAGNDVLNGFAGDDRLLGLGGNDTIDGGTGLDEMIGGTGNDIYVVDNIGDVVTELAGQGDDIVYSSISLTIPVNVEVLILQGTDNLNATGGAVRDIILGNGGDNIINGAGGIDVMEGLGGNDTYAVDNSSDAVIEAAGGGQDVVYTSVDYIMDGAQEIETAILTENAVVLRGDNSNNQLFGNDKINVLEGKQGTDYLLGLGGDDIFQVSKEANAMDLDVFGDFEGAGIVGGDRVALDAAQWGIDGIVTQVSQTSFVVSRADGSNGQQFIIANLEAGNSGLLAGDDYYFG